MPPGPPGWGPPGPGPQRPNNNAAVIIIAIVAGFVLLIGGGGVLWWLFDGGDPQGRPAARTVQDVPTPPGYSSLPVPSVTPYSPPTTYPPTTTYPPPTIYSPPPLHYGAIAVARDGSVGRAWDYGTRAAAERRAVNECPRSSCKVLVVFVNSCGAVAFNSRTNRYWGGRGATRTAAQKDAISNAGGGRWISWVCTTR